MKSIILIFAALCFAIGICSAQTWHVGSGDNVIELHSIFYFQDDLPVYFGTASDSAQLSNRLDRLSSRGVDADSIRIFFHWHYLTPDSSDIVLRNYNMGIFPTDTLGGEWYDEDWWDIVLGNVTNFFMPVEWAE